MADPKRKKQGESIKLPQELQGYLRQEIAPYNARGEKPPTRGRLLLDAWHKAYAPAGRDITPGSHPVPTIDSMANIPESVLTILHTHDPDCAECILALGRIWSVGDREIKDAIIRNCRVFARASEAIQEMKRGSGGQHQEEHPADFEKRVAKLLEAEAKNKPTDDGAPEPISDTEEGGPRVASVEEKPIRKIGGRRRNRG